jgi:phosphate transport system permease protein
MNKAAQHLAKRHRAERRFKALGLAALGFAGVMLLVLMLSIIRPGISGFTQHSLRVTVDTAGISAQLARDPAAVDYYALTNAALLKSVGAEHADAAARHQLLALGGTFGAFAVKEEILAHPAQWGKVMEVTLPLASNADLLLKGSIDRDAPMAERPISDQQIIWLDRWESEGRITSRFNSEFFTRGDSRAPEAAGFGGSIVGSLLTLLVCMLLALPVAIAAAITLEEFARKTKFAEWLEILINNLAAVPSIIYGLLGLSVFLQVLQVPRGSALAGGLTLAMLILPVMIIAARAAIRAVPPSMRQAATALGATKLQVVRDHVLPYALPGIMTGTILSIARALGETAPLLMIGMVAFVADVPRGFTDPATAMPVEVYLWASSPEAGFIEKTSAGIMVLLVLLLLLNMAAIMVRARSQKLWS